MKRLLTRLLTRQATFAPSTWREDGTVEATIATSAPVDVFDWAEGSMVRESLSVRGVALPASLRLLDSHRTDEVKRVLGSVRELRVDGDAIVGRVYWARHATLERDAVQDLHVTDFSIGYDIEEVTLLEPGQRVVINDEEHVAGEGALRVASRWTIHEATLCALGADAGAKVRARAGEERAMRDELKRDEEALLEERGGKDDDEEKRQDDDEEDDDDDEEDEEEKADERTKGDTLAERARQRKIRQLGHGVDPALVTRAMDEGWSMIRSSAAFLDDLRGRKPVRQRTARRGGGVSAQVLEDALLLQCGLWRAKSEQDADREVKAHAYSRMGPSALVEHSLRMCGRWRSGMARADAWGAQNRLEHERLTRAEPSATLTLPNLFSNVVNKAAMIGFSEQADSTMGWCSEGVIPDLKPAYRVRLGALPTPTEVPLGGTIEAGDVGEDAETYVLKRYGEMLVLDEIYLLNDDLNQFAQLAMMLGAAARRLRADLVYAILLANAALSDGTALFHPTSHGANLVSGAGSVLGDAALAAAVAVMGKQTGKQGEQLNLQPRFLLAPWELYPTALQLTGSERMVQAASGARIGDFNPWRGLFDVRVDGRLSNASFNANATATRWLLVASPMTTPTIEVGHLREQPEPRVVELPLDTSIRRKWEVVHYVGAKALDYRGMIRCEGV